MSRAKATLLAVSAAAAVLAGSGIGARAQVPTVPSSTTTTAATTTTRPTTTQPPGEEEPPITTTTTEAPSPAPAPGTPGTTTPPEAAPGPGGEPPAAESGPAPATPGGPVAGPPAPGGSGPAAAALGAGPAGPGQVPGDVQAAINAVRRSPANGTRRLLLALRPLEDLGLSEAELIRVGFGRFPVGGYATFSHDWLFPRYTPTFHLHQGTDVFAARGTPVRSPADGTLKLSQGGAGGLAAYVYQPDGTYYYMAHLDRFEAGRAPGQRVKTGDTVGYVGDSGNAKGGTPHLHFEIHPAPARAVASGTGRSRTVTYVTRPVAVGTVLPPVDPKAHLDQWLREALAAVPQLVASLEARPRALVATGLTRRLSNGRTGAFPGPVAPSRTQLLWASSANPTGGALRLALAEAMVAATEFNWSAAARRQQALLDQQLEAQAHTEAILGPLTPPALRRATTQASD